MQKIQYYGAAGPSVGRSQGRKDFASVANYIFFYSMRKVRRFASFSVRKVEFHTYLVCVRKASLAMQTNNITTLL